MTIDVSRLHQAHDAFLAAHAAMTKGALYDLGTQIVAETILHPGFKPRTGALQKATSTRLVRTAGGTLLRVMNQKAYARYLEEGTRPHVITARRAKMLRFIGRNGEYVFRRSVKHPGNRAYKWLVSAVENSGEQMRTSYLAEGMRRVASASY